MGAPLVLTGIDVADEPGSWAGAGFTVDGDRSRIGAVELHLTGRGDGTDGRRTRGITGLRLAGLAAQGDLDGLPVGPGRPPAGPAPGHANGATGIDHLVVLSPDVDRTIGVLEDRGAPALRTRHVDADQHGFAARQVFFRLGEVILELIGSDEPDAEAAGKPVTCFGLAHTVADLDQLPDLYGEHLGRIKDAVQPGRRIATLRHRELGLSVATAFMSPGPAAA